jgi:hypothetical protein
LSFSYLSAEGGRGFVKKSATLDQNDISQAASSNRLLERHSVHRCPLLARWHILREYVKSVQRNLRVVLEKEKEKECVLVS